MAAGDIVPVSGAQFGQTLASASPDVLRAMIRESAQRMMDADVEVACKRGRPGLGSRPARPGRRRADRQLAPAAAAHLDDAREDILAFTAFPREVWRQVWSNNSHRRSG